MAVLGFWVRSRRTLAAPRAGVDLAREKERKVGFRRRRWRLRWWTTLPATTLADRMEIAWLTEIAWEGSEGWQHRRWSLRGGRWWRLKGRSMSKPGVVLVVSRSRDARGEEALASVRAFWKRKRGCKPWTLLPRVSPFYLIHPPYVMLCFLLSFLRVHPVFNPYTSILYLLSTPLYLRMHPTCYSIHLPHVILMRPNIFF